MLEAVLGHLYKSLSSSHCKPEKTTRKTRVRIRGVFGRVEKRFPGPEKFTRKELRKVFGPEKFSVFRETHAWTREKSSKQQPFISWCFLKYFCYSQFLEFNSGNTILLYSIYCMQRKQNVQNDLFECKFHKVKYEVPRHEILCLKTAV